MNNPVLLLIQHLLSELRGGRSTSQALESFKSNERESWSKLYISNTKSKTIPVTSLEYELMFILERGEKGFPVLKSLQDLYSRATVKLQNQIELHATKTPFLALIPLFLLQMPSLIIIFIYPLLSELLESFQ